ncbi:DUF2306 domain-containing protein [uncultured Sphingomonas sp.]|uniref:DUF2306 domain-containing protein n=1 Tax=uncultured Sphingomonas sp. TaxID=158754 RepID=UPI0035C9C00A
MPEVQLLARPKLLRLEAERLVTWTRPLIHRTVFVLAVAVALLSYRYLLNIGPVPPIIAANRFRTVWLVVHVGFASTALLTGVIQFSGKMRCSRPGLHRRMGRIYASSCLIGAVAGLVLALGSSAGPIASVGFGGLAVVWFYATWLGWRRAMSGRFASHRRWMIRSWALTLAAVTLRIYIPLFEVMGLPDLPSYRAISVLCWVPNLFVAEFLIGREAGRREPGSRSTASTASTNLSMPQRAG